MDRAKARSRNHRRAPIPATRHAHRTSPARASSGILLRSAYPAPRAEKRDFAHFRFSLQEKHSAREIPPGRASLIDRCADRGLILHAQTLNCRGRGRQSTQRESWRTPILRASCRLNDDIRRVQLLQRGLRSSRACRRALNVISNPGTDARGQAPALFGGRSRGHRGSRGILEIRE